MLIRILLGLAAVVLVLLAMRWFSRAKPAQVAKMIRVAGLGLLVAGGLFLVLTGKLAGIFAVLAGLAPWIARLMRLHSVYRMVKQFGVRMGGGKAAAGTTSDVETRFLRMTLDHDTGALDGVVLDGPLRGVMLSQLSLDQALDLWRQVQADLQSTQVLESWLERTWPDWRAGTSSEAPTPSGAMTREEAWQVLGLSPGASDDDIREAHRRLMRLAHPDAGGSTWIAARLNQARDLLLG
jgi:hypothetical protein